MKNACARTAFVLKASVCAFALAGASAAYAQDLAPAGSDDQADNEVAEDETNENLVVVTARFREETSQDIGASIAALDASVIEEEGITDFQSIANRIVGLDSIDRGPNQNDPSLRGVSNNTISISADTGRYSPLISQFFDDIPVSAATGSQKDFAMFDIERIEVLRGPQPTLFGEGAVGGAIRFVSRSPDLGATGINDIVLQSEISDTKDGSLAYRFSGAASATLVPDELAVRTSFSYRDGGGFIDYPVLGLTDANDFEQFSGRIVIVGEPTDRFSFRIVGMYGEDESFGANIAAPPPASPKDLVFNSAVLPPTTDTYGMLSVNLAYDFGPITVTSISSYYNRDFDSTVAADVLAQLFSVSASFGADPFLFPTALTLQAIEDELFSQEFRFVSDFDGPLNFVAGLNYQSVDSTAETLVDIPGFAAVTGPLFINPADATDEVVAAINTFETEQWSAFAEFTFSVSDRLRLIGGARYLREEIVSTFVQERSVFPITPPLFPPYIVNDTGDLLELAGVNVSQAFVLDKLLPRAAIEFDASDDVLLYASVATGARNGNINSLGNALLASSGDPALLNQFTTFNEDEILSFEAGMKSTWLNNDLIVNVSAFHSTYKDPQITFIINSGVTGNGPDIDIFGVEFESFWQITDIFSAYVNASYQDAAFQGDQLLTAGIFTEPDLREGNRPINVPEWSVAAGADFDVPLSDTIALKGGVSYSHTGSRFSTPQNFVSTELAPLDIFNIRLGFEGEWWSLQAYVRNLTNDVEFVTLFGNEGQSGFRTPDGGFDLVVTDAAVNRPRTIGLVGTLKF
ncbi:MAG: TonB-dependent receptor [Pseudomonadota bacterium]